MAIEQTQMNDEETYRYTERIAILCGDGVPTEVQREMAMGDVRRFREEMKEQEL